MRQKVVFFTQDAEDAHHYWKDKEFKKWAVDFEVGPSRRPVRSGTIYVQTRTADRSIEAARANAIPALPASARCVARLAGPRELGCVPG